MKKKAVTLIGPRSVGKTTVGKLLAKILNAKHIDLDMYSNKKLSKQGGITGFIDKYKVYGGDTLAWAYYHRYQFRFLKEIFSKKGKFVLDIGGGTFFEVFSDDKRNAEFIKRQSVVIALLPTKSLKKSVTFLFKREKKRPHWKKKNFPDKELKWYVERDYTGLLPILNKYADFKIYVENKTKEQVVDRILKRM